MIIVNRKKKADSVPLKNDSYRDDCIGFWGNVIGIDTESLSVDVQACTGMKYKGIPCISQEWVVYDKNKNYVPAERDLPPLNSRVFVLMPTHTLSGAFVLCSGFARGEPSVKGLFAKNETEKEEYRTIKEHITQGGWKEKEFAETGNKTLESEDGNISVNIITKDDNQKGIKKEVSIKAWNQTVKINADGVYINTDKKVKIDGSEVDLNGDSQTLVTYAALNSALSTFLTQLSTSLSSTPILGNGSPQVWTAFPTAIDISAAEAKKVKTGGGV